MRGFIASPAFLLMIAPILREFCPSGRPTNAQIVEAAAFATHPLGISPHAWAQACNTMGRFEAAVAIAVIAAKRDAGKVITPGGLLRGMVERHLEGNLRLDRTLFGLADALGDRMKGPHRSRSSKAPMH